MQYVRPATVVAALSIILASSGLSGQNLSITNYQVVSQFGSNVTYRADLVNSGPALTSVKATATSLDPFSFRVVNGQDFLDFQPVPASSTVRSNNTFTIYLTNPITPFDPSKLQWSYQTVAGGPVADAGPDQTASIGNKITLDGSKSTNPSGVGTLTYSWSFVSVPAGSTAFLSLSGTVMPFFTVDVPGVYVAKLTVSNGTATSSDTVQISTYTMAPVANAGPDQAVTLNSLVQLDGSGSTDPNGLTLTYQWTLTTPQGSAAVLSNPTAVKPTFTADKIGTFTASLTVRDSAGLVSNADTVNIVTTGSLPPTANAGQNQTVPTGTTVQLNCTGTDPNTPPLVPLTYKWALNTKPAGSAATLSSTTIQNPSILVDVVGNYVAQCTATNTASLASQPSTVTISTTCAPPTANAGPNQTVSVGALVTLNGSGSGDACQNPLTYSWTFLSRPTGSAAALANPTAVNPTFTADLEGTYVVQLTVNNGSMSATSTVTITAGGGGIMFMTNPLTLTGGTGSSAVFIPSPAGPGGQLIALSSSNTAIATVPASILIPPGQVRGTVQVTAGTMSGIALITASSGLLSGTLTVNVTLPGLTVALDSGSLGLTNTMNGTVTLPGPAAAQTTVTLSTAPTGIVTLQPTTLIIPAGGTSGNFTVTGDSLGTTTITATAPTYNAGSANVHVGYMGQITLPVGTMVAPGQSLPYQVKLLVGAPPNGVTVNLVSSDTSKVTISPSSVFIPFRSTSPATLPMVTGVNLGSANITATATGFIGDTQSVQVAAALYFTPASVLIYGGVMPPSFTVNVSAPAPPGGYNITLSSSAPGVITVPANVIIPAGQNLANVPLTAIGGQGTAKITASGPGLGTAEANVTVTVAPLNVTPSFTLGVGQSAPFPIYLDAAAPLGGVTITLASSDPNKVIVTPSTVYISSGHTTNTDAQITGVNIGSANITASAPGWTAGTSVVKVPATLTFSPSSATINANQTQNFGLCLSTAAGNGLTINVSSGNPSVATVAPTLVIPAGQTCGTVVVTGIAPGSAVIHASALPAVPDATANITVQSFGNITLPASTSLVNGQTVTIPVTLSAPAPAGGVVVSLSTSNASIATVQPTVNIAGGGTTGNATVTGTGAGSATITATATGWVSGTGSVQVAGQSLSFTPNTLTINGGSQNTSLCLSPAAVSNMTFNLVSSSPGVASVPATAAIAAGQTCTTVQVTALGAGSSTITASSGALSATLAVTVPNPPMSIVPATLAMAPGQTAQIQVVLSNAAPNGGIFVNLASSDTSKATVSPAAILIPQGSKTSTFITVNAVAVGSATVTATAFGMVPASQVVTVSTGGGGPATASFSPGTLNIVGTATQNLTLNLSAPAPSTITVTLTSGNAGVATVPASVVIPANANSATVPVTGVAQGTTTVSATVPGFGTATANVNVSQSPSSGIIIPANTTVAPGQSVAFPVSLAAPAPSGGVFIILSSSNTAVATITPANVFIVQGATAPAYTPQLNGLTAGSATITANASGFPNATGNVLVASTTSMGFSPSNLTITGTNTVNTTLTLPSPAPSGGQTINLISSNPGVATVPATVTVSSYGVNVTVPVTGVAPGTATITASTTGNIGNATANITVVGSSPINMPSGVKIGPGETVNFPITLATPAPSGGVFMTLTSSDPNVLTIVPNSLFFTAGSTTTASTPRVTGVNFGQVSITATAPPLGAASEQVIVGATLNLQPSNIVVTGTNMLTTLTLTLSSAAPAGGVTVNVASSDTSVATVPSTVFIPANSNNVNIVVRSVGLGSAAISASALPSLPAAVTTVSVIGAPEVILPVFESVGVTHTVQVPVSLSAPAPAGGVTITLKSSNTDRYIVTPTTVYVPAGATVPTSQPSIKAGDLYTSEGWATLTAAAPGYLTASLDILVVDMMTLAMPPHPTVGVGLTIPLPIALPGPAPAGGVLINLTSSDPTRVEVTPTVFVPEGTNLPINPPLITGLDFGKSTISATSPRYISGIQTVTVITQLRFTPAAITVSGNAIGNLVLTMSGPAPANGLTVNLGSSNPGIATVPTSVFFPQNATTVSVPVTGSGTGTATITAVPAITGIPGTTATVTRN